MATMASAVRDIQTFGRDNLTAVAARSVPVTRVHPQPLPTPPNSISPVLPPHGLKAQLQRAKLEPIDSDLDLQDGQDFHHAGNHHDHDHDHTATGLGSPPYDSAGAITPAMLAKFHLPEILLNHGPLAIRHVMGYLTTSVPGFAGIPPAKARRLVVGALEGRGSGGEGGGLDGDVEFEKVGWGRWDARRRGQPPRSCSTLSSSLRRERSPQQNNGSSSYGGSAAAAGIPIFPAKAGWSAERTRLTISRSSGEDGESAVFSHDGRDITMLENEADKMSMDDSASASCSEAPDEDDDDVVMNDDPEDVTDDEDWAAVGAAALRASSYQAQSHDPSSLLHNNNNTNNNNNSVYTPARGGMRSVSATTGMTRQPQLGNFDFSAFGATSDAQEREAVEALLRLGSV